MREKRLKIIETAISGWILIIIYLLILSENFIIALLVALKDYILRVNILSSPVDFAVFFGLIFLLLCLFLFTLKKTVFSIKFDDKNIDKNKMMKIVVLLAFLSAVIVFFLCYLLITKQMGNVLENLIFLVNYGIHRIMAVFFGLIFLLLCLFLFTLKETTFSIKFEGTENLDKSKKTMIKATVLLFFVFFLMILSGSALEAIISFVQYNIHHFGYIYNLIVNLVIFIFVCLPNSIIFLIITIGLENNVKQSE